MYQLLHPLQPTPGVPGNLTMQLASVDSLLVLMDECAIRMGFWKGAILNAVARCFVTMKDNDGSSHCFLTFVSVDSPQVDMNNELVKSLRLICQKLAETCPSVVQVHRNIAVTSKANKKPGRIRSAVEVGS